MIKALLPKDNVLHKIKTYDKLKRLFNFPEVNERKFCMICHDTLEPEQNCPNEECISKKKYNVYENVKDPIITEFDYVKDFKDIVERNLNEIQRFRQQLDDQSVSDLCNGKYYKSRNLDSNSIGMCFFADAAKFRGSVDGSIQGLFAYIPEFPPALRAAFHNILKLFLITGSKFSFNGIFKKQMHKLRKLLKDGIVLKNGMHFNVYIYGLIGDEPGRSSACSHKQHNDEHGCIFCLNPGVGNGGTRYWPGIDYPLRTEEIYKQQLKDKGPAKTHMGLKDKCSSASLLHTQDVNL